jgi:ketosteroid isomerase-like protein
MSVALVRKVYEAFSRGDLAAAFRDFHPQIEWREAENFTYADGNPYIGPDRVLQGVFARLGVDFDDFKVLPQEFVGTGDTVVALGRYQGRVRATGKKIDARFAHVWRVEGDNLRGFEQLTDTAQFNSATRG